VRFFQKMPVLGEACIAGSAVDRWNMYDEKEGGEVDG
jgi:hypothetical protein